MDIRKLQRVIVDGLEDVKAQNIVVFNTEHLSPLFERVVIASGTSNRQTKSLASSVREAVKAAGDPVPRVEGEENGEWIIVDCGAAVVHVMQPSIRDYYHLEELWGEKPVKMKIDGGAPRPLAGPSLAPRKAPTRAPADATSTAPKAARKTSTSEGRATEGRATEGRAAKGTATRATATKSAAPTKSPTTRATTSAKAPAKAKPAAAKSGASARPARPSAKPGVTRSAGVKRASTPPVVSRSSGTAASTSRSAAPSAAGARPRTPTRAPAKTASRKPPTGR